MIKRNELLNLLVKPDMADILLTKPKEDIKQMLGKECSSMVGYDQNNPHHCYNLFEHCVRTVENITVSNDTDVLLRVAALFHDIGKPFVAREKEGRLVFYCHAEKSYRIMQKVLTKFGFSTSECFYILFWIRHHDDFISYTDDKEKTVRGGHIFISDSTIRKYITRLREKYNQLTEEELSMLLQGLVNLCKADAKSQSEYVYMKGKLVDSREGKVRRLELITSIVSKTLS